MRLVFIALWLILSGCGTFKSVMVVDTIGGGYYHVVGMTDNYSDVIKLPYGTTEGSIIKIKLKGHEK